jgi:hypothetical protein
MKGKRVFMGSLTQIKVHAWPSLGGKLFELFYGPFIKLTFEPKLWQWDDHVEWMRYDAQLNTQLLNPRENFTCTRFLENGSKSYHQASNKN